MNKTENSYLKEFENLSKKGESFVVATVISREAPSSGKVGDKAIINKNGEMFGWIGGGCVKGIVLKEAHESLKTAKPCVVKIGAEIDDSDKEAKVYKMTCHSEGKLSLFIEPIMPPPHLVVIGKSQIAKALVHMAKTMEYKVTAVSENVNLKTFTTVDELITRIHLEDVKISPTSMILVATQGEQDEKALMEAIKKAPLWIGFIASKKKMSKIKQSLVQLGVSESDINKINSPAGIDINAKKPYEIAVSILAELIQVKNQLMEDFDFLGEDNLANGEVKPTNFYINPVCGIPIDKDNAKHILEYKKEKVYFCCDGCKVKFEKEPELYMEK